MTPMDDQLPAPIAPARVSRMLTAAEFRKLADVPPEVEWFANLTNAHTHRAYENAVNDFMRFAGIERPEEFRSVTRAHVIAWRDDLKTRVTRRGEAWSDASIRHRLSALAALFEYLCDQNAVTHNPVKGVARPKSERGEGKTPAIADHQARKLLEAPQDDRSAASATAPFSRPCSFTRCAVRSYASSRSRTSAHVRKGVPHLKVSGKGGKVRYLPLHPGTNGLINDYLEAAGHGADDAGALFRPLKNNAQRHDRLAKAITPDGVYKLVKAYSAQLGFEIGAHALRATAATNALDHQADIAKVRSGLATPTSPPRGSTIIAAPGPSTVRRSR